MDRVRPKSMFFVCVTVGLVLFASKYRENVCRGFRQLCNSLRVKRKSKDEEEVDIGMTSSNEFRISLNKVVLVESLDSCDRAIQHIRCNSSKGVLGFDCKCVEKGPVSMLQIATRSGACALFRLNKIGQVPPQLKELLGNKQWLKVGLDPIQDGERLLKDYECTVAGTVDLRLLAERFSLPQDDCLEGFCKRYLSREMGKFVDVSCSDWNADRLTDDQVAYAAYYAMVAVHIYEKMLMQAKPLKAKLPKTWWRNLIAFWKKIENEDPFSDSDLPKDLIDKRYITIAEELGMNNLHYNNKCLPCIPAIPDISHNDSSQSRENCEEKPSKQYLLSNGYPAKGQVPTRYKPLYHNCYLEAPDGETLCTCDRKKADWYVMKELGNVVCEDPFTVRLTFEPSGRALGNVGAYYTKVKKNECVVCGAEDKFIRKNVVPREYRKYFPLVMKSHQSHDVLLLCPACHNTSTQYDLVLRRQLAEECNAPLMPPAMKDENKKKLKNMRTTIKLFIEGKKISEKDNENLKALIKALTGHDKIDKDLLKSLSENCATQGKLDKDQTTPKLVFRDTSSPKKVKSDSHGLLVVQYYENSGGGLVNLEQKWREHFLTCMQPKFLPELWSVSHNQERLKSRQAQNRIQPQDAKIAGLDS